MGQTSSLFSSDRQTTAIEDAAKQKYLEEEKERLRAFEVYTFYSFLCNCGGIIMVMIVGGDWRSAL